MAYHANGQLMDAKVSAVKQKAYLKSGGTKCPNCGSASISAGSSEADGTSAFQDVVCLDCGSTWTEEYKLARFGDLKVPTHN